VGPHRKGVTFWESKGGVRWAGNFIEGGNLGLSTVILKLSREDIRGGCLEAPPKTGGNQ